MAHGCDPARKTASLATNATVSVAVKSKVMFCNNWRPLSKSRQKSFAQDGPKPASALIFGLLALPKLRVAPIARQQVIMGALLDDLAFLQHDDPVRFGHGR